MQKLTVIQIGSKRTVVSRYHEDTKETEYLIINNDYFNFLNKWGFIE